MVKMTIYMLFATLVGYFWLGFEIGIKALLPILFLRAVTYFYEQIEKHAREGGEGKYMTRTSSRARLLSALFPLKHKKSK